MAGKLYIVATPIGNLDDITIRALNILKEVDLIAAEDTRHTLGLLNHFEISKKLISYYKENEKVKSDLIINKLLEGNNVAVVSDAGTPGISDPGEEVIKKAIENNIDVVPIPGACAAINALVCSGFSTREFLFLGFLSAKKSEKIKKLDDIKYEPRTLIIYEAPHKLKDTLESIYETLGNRQITIAREITKIHEEFIRGKVADLINTIEYRGECVIIIEGSDVTQKDVDKQKLQDLDIEEHYEYYEKQGMSKKDIIKQIAKDRNVSRNDIYQRFLDK